MNELIHQWLALVEAGQFLEAEEQVETFIKSYASQDEHTQEAAEPLHAQLIGVVSRFNQLQADIRQNTVRTAEASVARAQLDQALIGLIQTLNDEPELVAFAETYQQEIEAPTPDKPPKRDTRMLMLGGGIVLVVVAILGIWALVGDQDEKRLEADRQAWTRIKAADLQGLISYINRTQTDDIPGQHLEEASTQVDSLLWAEAEERLEVAYFEQYLDQCAALGIDCQHQADAEVFVKQLANEATLWDTIKDSASLQRLLTFMLNFPQGRHRTEVKDRLMQAVADLNGDPDLKLHFTFDDSTIYLDDISVRFYGKGSKPDFVPGKLGRALHLNGQDQYLQVENKSYLNAASYTLTTWVRVVRSFAGSDHAMIQKPYYRSKKIQYALQIQGDEAESSQMGLRPRFIAKAAEQSYGRFKEMGWNPNTWYFLAMVVNPDAGWVKTYINDQMQDSLAWQGMKGRVRYGDLFIGTQGESRSFRKRTFSPIDLDEIRYYRRALMKEDLADIYEYGRRAELITAVLAQ